MTGTIFLDRNTRCWTIFTDSKAALQTLSSLTRRCLQDQLAYNILLQLPRVLYPCHMVCLHWVPSHSGIPGNEAADTPVFQIPYSRIEVSGTVRKGARQFSCSLWARPDCPHSYSHSLDPNMTFRVPIGTSRCHEGVLHLLRLGVAYTRDYLLRIQNVAFPECAVCEAPQTVTHLFRECLIYVMERTKLRFALSLLDNRLLTAAKGLGAWPTQEHSILDSKGSPTFLARLNT